MKEDYKKKQMETMSNLITDMILQGADKKEIEKEVRNSMDIIDSLKKLTRE